MLDNMGNADKPMPFAEYIGIPVFGQTGVCHEPKVIDMLQQEIRFHTWNMAHTACNLGNSRLFLAPFEPWPATQPWDDSMRSMRSMHSSHNPLPSYQSIMKKETPLSWMLFFTCQDGQFMKFTTASQGFISWHWTTASIRTPCFNQWIQLWFLIPMKLLDSVVIGRS